MATLVHVTHEAVLQAGGIGTVLRGLITADSYRAHCQRTILLGPLTDPEKEQSLGQGGEVLYDADRQIRTGEVADALSLVESQCSVRIIYGRRVLDQDGRRARPEVILVDVRRPPHGLNDFKHMLFQHFGLDSQRNEQQWEYERYVRMAEPFMLLFHEFMGLATAFKALLSDAGNCKTLFYAHEVATVRPLIEQGPVRDIAFYNGMRKA